MNEIISQLSTNQKRLCAIDLNKLAKKFPSIQKRPIPKHISKIRDRQFVLIRDMLEIIATLMKMKKKKCVHVAIDLYLSLLAGQRTISDAPSIEKNLLKNLALEDPAPYFSIEVKKTKIKSLTIAINEQLLQLLIAFKWPGWNPEIVAIV
jgi:hypothetical protein